MLGAAKSFLGDIAGSGAAAAMGAAKYGDSLLGTAGLAASRTLGSPLRTMGVGAAMGGFWGAASDDTSVIGGMAMGAGLGGVASFGRSLGSSASTLGRASGGLRGLSQLSGGQLSSMAGAAFSSAGRQFMRGGIRDADNLLGLARASSRQLGPLLASHNAPNAIQGLNRRSIMYAVRGQRYLGGLMSSF